jgi:2-amino-4-hydroxy-6-hydroxymethyldihydropteridine diphosphokinase
MLSAPITLRHHSSPLSGSVVAARETMAEAGAPDAVCTSLNAAAAVVGGEAVKATNEARSGSKVNQGNHPGYFWLAMRAFVGLGSNLGDRERTLERAVSELRRLRETDVRGISSFRDTAPVGYLEQPRFLNGAVELETAQPARELLDELLRIERELGRDRARSVPQGPRPIDLDLLLYGSEQIREPGLEVPHPRLHERRFVLEPLFDLDPGLFVPGRGPIQALLSGLDSHR